MDPRDITRSIYGLCKFNYSDDGGVAVGVLSAQARRRIYNYSMDDLSQIAVSVCRVKVKNQPLVKALVSRVSEDSVRDMRSVSIVNLMSAFSRWSVVGGSWKILADELAQRLAPGSSPPVLSRDDMLSAIMSYSFPHIGSAHEILFSSVSESLLHPKGREPLSADQVCRYVKACARTQYRNLSTLAYCAQSLRSGEGNSIDHHLSNEKVLQLCIGLDKLGAEMKEVDEAILKRGLRSLPQRTGVTWFKKK
jgi:hypothetical protein